MRDASGRATSEAAAAPLVTTREEAVLANQTSLVNKLLAMKCVN